MRENPGIEPFAERVIICADSDSAEQEARTQQQVETEGAVWSHLRLDGDWVAKRYPPPPPSPPITVKGLWRAFRDSLNPFDATTL